MIFGTMLAITPMFSADTKPPASIIPNGDFALDKKGDGWPDGWGSKPEGTGVTWEVDKEGKHFMRLVSQNPGQLQVLYRELNLKEGALRGISFSIRYKTSAVKTGEQESQCAGALFLFKDSAGRILNTEAKPLVFSPSAKDWTDAGVQLPVPANAARLIVMTGLLKAAAGTVDVASVTAAPMTDEDAEKIALEPQKRTSAPESLISNSDFEKPNGAGDWPEGWGSNKPGNGMTWEIEKDKHYVRLVQQKPGEMFTLYRIVRLKPGMKGVELTIRSRTSGVKPGEHEWFDARTLVDFLDADGNKVAHEGGSLDFVFTHKPEPTDWKESSHSYVVPEGAVQMQLMPGLFKAAAGTVDLAEIRLVPMSDEATNLMHLANEAYGISKGQANAASERAMDDKIEAQLAETGNLMPNGNFSAKSPDAAWPDGWGKSPPENLSYGNEDGKRFIRMVSPSVDKTLLLYKMVVLKKNLKGLEVKIRYRTADIKNGPKMPGDARVVMHFLAGSRTGHLEYGNVLTPDAPSITFSGKAQGWTEITKRFLVPEGATKLQFMPGLWGVKSGTLDLAEIQVKPLSDAEADAISSEAAAVAKKKADQNAIIAKDLALPPITRELKVSGNKIVTPDGKTPWLQGLCVDSMQWSTGDNILWSIHVAIDEWKSNVIRLPVHDSFWFGHGKGQKEGTEENYRQTVDKAVKLCAAKGAYLVLDLHTFGAPTQEHLEFWKDAAVRYKNNPAVLFELFNEPHGISWEIWRNGGSLSSAKNKVADVNPIENKEKVADSSIGMQAIVEAVRATGAKNMIVSGGLDWSYDLSGIVNGYALDDKGGNGIMYVSHIYPWKKDWKEKVLVAVDKYPIIITEIGCPAKWEDFSFIPESQRYPLEGWSENVLGLIQKYKLNWTGFSFHPHCGPQVILDWNYTPTPYWGIYVKQALQGRQFELKQLR